MARRALLLSTGVLVCGLVAAAMPAAGRPVSPSAAVRVSVVPTPTVVDGWAQATIGGGPTYDRRTPRQGLAWMGGNRVLAAWIEAPAPFGVASTTSGPLLLRFFNIDGDWSSPTKFVQKHARGVQALTTGPIDSGPCQVVSPVESRAASGPGTGTSHAFRTFLAVYGGDADEANLKIYRVYWCGATTTVTVIKTFADARLGAMAGRRVCTPVACTQNILLVYERNGLRGRFMTGNGVFGAEFTIDPDVGERRYIDITWNPVSRRFFVGYNVIGDGFKQCSIRQVAVPPAGPPVFVKEVANTCDPLNGGHRSASSTDVDLTRNPRGRYLWYFQPGGHNNVHLMDNQGEVVKRLDLGQGPILDLPVPVSLADVHEKGPASYAATVRYQGAPIEPPVAFLTLAPNGTVLTTHELPFGFPLAVEALRSVVVAGTGLDCFSTDRMCSSWVLTAFDL